MKVLNTDDILEALSLQENMPGRDMYILAVEAAVEAAGYALAQHLGIQPGEASWEGKALAGLCMTFGPAYEDQPCPAVIDEGDPGGDWDND